MGSTPIHFRSTFRKPAGMANAESGMLLVEKWLIERRISFAQSSAMHRRHYVLVEMVRLPG
jgi:hypothetical protein